MREIIAIDRKERKSFWMMLRSEYHIRFAATARRGLSMLSENVDLVFLSMELPDMNSMEVMGLINRKFPSITVSVIASSQTEEAYLNLSGKETSASGIPSHLLSGVLRVKDFIDQNLSKDLTLAAACKMASMSRTYFCRFFKNVTGHSLRNYQHVVKMRIANELFRDKRLPVKVVARKLGYQDANYFSTLFKKINGTSPRQRQSSDQTLDHQWF
ncbi:MAG: DNA-binding response regulator [Nitrospiraceae bacterium]|nr:MAG: DNA-binding response regulator [Nitrospiraceae bacterium]